MEIPFDDLPEPLKQMILGDQKMKRIRDLSGMDAKKEAFNAQRDERAFRVMNALRDAAVCEQDCLLAIHHMIEAATAVDEAMENMPSALVVIARRYIAEANLATAQGIEEFTVAAKAAEAPFTNSVFVNWHIT